LPAKGVYIRYDKISGRKIGCDKVVLILLEYAKRSAIWVKKLSREDSLPCMSLLYSLSRCDASENWYRNWFRNLSPIAKSGTAGIFGQTVVKFRNYRKILKGGAVQKFQGIILTICRIRPLWPIAFIAVVTLISGVAFGAGESKAGGTDTKLKNIPIQITAEQLISNNEENYAEFIGNVKATQGNFMITSDRLRIYYQGDLLKTQKERNDEELLKKIVATGHVKITSDQYSAETDKVEYDTVAMTIVLIGEDSKVFSGKDSITGSKITFNRKDGRIKVEGSKNKRIKAEFYTKDETSNAFKLGKPE